MTEDPAQAEREEQCLLQLSRSNITIEGPYCRGTFDGWLCWPDTPAGSSAMAHCPDFIIGFDSTRMAYKTCDEDASWFKHPLNNHTWSNYTTCINLDDLEWRQNVNLTYETGYSISLIALIISLALLSYFRSLRCARITMHMNLFVSFALNNALWLLWYRAVVADPQVPINNGVSCPALPFANSSALSSPASVVKSNPKFRSYITCLELSV